MPLAEKIEKKYTYKDYLTWNDDERWEIINGKVYSMTPAPKIKHQIISRNFVWKFGEQKNKLKNCQLFEAPTDVVFDDENVVQPDILIVCDKNKITENCIKGAPDLIIEIVSENTELKDKREKFLLYEKFGVKEYIIVFPDREYLERYVLENKKYSAPEIFNWDEEFSFKIFNIKINLWEIFEKEKPEKGEKK